MSLFHTGHTGIGAGMPGRRRDAAEVLQPDVRRRRGGRLPGDEDHPRPPVLPVAGRSDLGRPPQAERLHRPLGLVAEVLPAETRPLREHAAPRQLLFGSDYPLITPDRWLADFEGAGFKDEVKPLILKENAARLLGLR